MKLKMPHQVTDLCHHGNYSMMFPLSSSDYTSSFNIRVVVFWSVWFGLRQSPMHRMLTLSCYIAEDNTELLTLLPLSPKCLDCGCVLPHLVSVVLEIAAFVHVK